MSTGKNGPTGPTEQGSLTTPHSPGNPGRSSDPDRGANTAKMPKTYRLSALAISAVDAAVGQAMMRGQRLSREEAVDAAIRETYGHLVQPDQPNK